MGELYQRLEQLRCEAYDLAEIIRDKREAFDFSPAELDAVESRSDLLYRLKKKYGATVEEMLAYLDKCRRELDDMETADDTLARLEQQLEKARKAVLAAGAELTAAGKRPPPFWSSASSPSSGTWTCTRSGSPSTSGRRSRAPTAVTPSGF